MFQHTAARRRLREHGLRNLFFFAFQHTAARRRLRDRSHCHDRDRPFQHTAARRRLLASSKRLLPDVSVSTHSRPKAAANHFFKLCGNRFSFNTQPPEGGCVKRMGKWRIKYCFNTQPPEGGCFDWHICFVTICMVSTHSRPKAAAISATLNKIMMWRFNTQPPEGGCRHGAQTAHRQLLFQHTAARRRLQSGKIITQIA